MSEHSEVKLSLKNLYKVFGESTDKALAMGQEGIAKDQILAETGCTLGVRDASFDVLKGEIFVVMGLSGSGKSTLVRLLNRLIEPSSGQVLIDDEDVASMTEERLQQVRRSKIAMVFQSFALMPHMSVLENAAFGLEVAGVDEGSRIDRARQALAQVGLAQWETASPSSLSGGMKQRVGLARALANDPDILLMDEAFSALDPLIRREMQDQLLALQHQEQRTIVFISHDLDEAIRIGDRIAIMQDGVVVQVGTPDEILNNPASDYVASFFNDVDLGKVATARDAAYDAVVLSSDVVPAEALAQMISAHSETAVVVTPGSGDVMGMVDQATLRRVNGSGDALGAVMQPVEALVSDAPLNDILGKVGGSDLPLPVVCSEGRVAGVVDASSVLRQLAASESKLMAEMEGAA